MAKKFKPTSKKAMMLLEQSLKLNGVLQTMASHLETDVDTLYAHITLLMMKQSRDDLEVAELYALLSQSQRYILDDVLYVRDDEKYADVLEDIIDWMNEHTGFKQMLEEQLTTLWGKPDGEMN